MTFIERTNWNSVDVTTTSTSVTFTPEDGSPHLDDLELARALWDTMPQ